MLNDICLIAISISQLMSCKASQTHCAVCLTWLWREYKWSWVTSFDTTCCLSTRVSSYACDKTFWSSILVFLHSRSWVLNWTVCSDQSVLACPQCTNASGVNANGPSSKGVLSHIGRLFSNLSSTLADGAVSGLWLRTLITKGSPAIDSDRVIDLSSSSWYLDAVSMALEVPANWSFGVGECHPTDGDIDCSLCSGAIRSCTFRVGLQWLVMPWLSIGCLVWDVGAHASSTHRVSDLEWWWWWSPELVWWLLGMGHGDGEHQNFLRCRRTIFTSSPSTS